jgi:hypothetical protein
MHHIPRLSEAVYAGLCHEVGTPSEVRIRRDVMDTMEVVKSPVMIMKRLDRMESGSRREGFRRRTSDRDIMLWPPDHKVICDLSQIGLYRIPQHTVILMECEDLPPGFTRLKLITDSYDGRVRSSCVYRDGEFYVLESYIEQLMVSFVEIRILFIMPLSHMDHVYLTHKEVCGHVYEAILGLRHVLSIF